MSSEKTEEPTAKKLRDARDKGQIAKSQDVTTAVLMCTLFAVIAVLSVRVVWDDYRFEETSPGIGVPQWWYSVWLPILSLLITWRAIGLLIRRTRQPDVEFLGNDADDDGERQP